MDSITLDVTGIPEARVQPGQEVDLLCAQQTVDDVAREAGTIGYEVLTRLGAASIGVSRVRFPRDSDPGVLTRRVWEPGSPPRGMTGQSPKGKTGL
jgi:hypothetical protein